ncbi:MAG TPA: metal ABC transporter substrate-binding protein [Longimicrobiales bacterium]|nr:metal ABC transporter substrate-binding protein [Longimicrobiales bacterium]
MKQTIYGGLVLAVLAGVLAGCGPARDTAAGNDDAGTVVVVTIHPIADLMQRVAGPAARITELLPAGVSPGTYDPTPMAARAVASAQLVVRVGGAVDDWVAGLVEGSDVPVVVLTAGMKLKGATDEPGTGNPHVWLDPILVRDTLLPRMLDALQGVLPDSAEALRRRAAAVADSLTDLDAQIRAILAHIRSPDFVASHAAWDYFAARYGLVPVGALHPSPGQELGARELADLVNDARRMHVAGVIAEPQLGEAGVKALAAELKLPVQVADPLGAANLPGRASYFDLLRYDAHAFARALGGE